MLRSILAMTAALGVLLGVPFLLRPADGDAGDAGRRLIILTPHNELIRWEFRRAFTEWHRARFGEAVDVVYSVPGGAGDILTLLQAQFEAALMAGEAPGGGADLLFGGGTWIHDQLVKGVTVEVGSEVRSASISAPAGFDEEWVKAIYGQEAIGERRLYDPGQHWFATAISSFGIIFNRDCLALLGRPDPDSFEDLADPALHGWVALANPAQSGSITSVFEVIIQRQGWRRGWQLLRRAGANSRSFSPGSPRSPMDVSLGQAAAGMCIDFYGRFESQAVAEAGDPRRIGYVDPPGEVTFDPDPVSILRGAPDVELARRFVEFCLSEQGQALWQLPAAPEAALGPQRYELRRLPARRSLYDDHFNRFIDAVNPFEMEPPRALASPDSRSFIPPLFLAMAVDTHDELRAAWRAIIEHPAYPKSNGIVTAADVDDPELRSMLERFDSMPTTPGPGGEPLSLATDGALGEALRGWENRDLWPAEAEPAPWCRSRWAAYFREQYRTISAGRS